MDKHGENCNCEEGLDHDQVTLTLEDGTEVVCDIIAVFPCGEKEYIALLPQNGGDEGEVYLYQFIDAEEFDELMGEEEEEE